MCVFVSLVRSERKHVREVEVEKWLRATPSKSKASSHLFRNLRDNGETHMLLANLCLTYLITLLFAVSVLS